MKAFLYFLLFSLVAFVSADDNYLPVPEGDTGHLPTPSSGRSEADELVMANLIDFPELYDAVSAVAPTLDTIPADVLASHIVKPFLMPNNDDLKSLRSTSKAIKGHLMDQLLSHFSILGNATHILSDPSICRLMNVYPETKRHVRVLYATAAVMHVCGINADSAPHLEEVYLVIDDFTKKAMIAIHENYMKNRAAQPSAPTPMVMTRRAKSSQPPAPQPFKTIEVRNPVIRTWMDTRLHFQKSLKKLEVVDTKKRSVLHHILLDRHFPKKMPALAHVLSTKLSNPSIYPGDGLTPLQACFVPQYFTLPAHARFNMVECIDLLMKAGADIHALNKNGRALIHMAAESHNATLAEHVLKWGADVNMYGKSHLGSDLTPLHLSLYVWYRQAETNAELFLEYYKEWHDGPILEMQQNQLHMFGTNSRLRMDAFDTNSTAEFALVAAKPDLFKMTFKTTPLSDAVSRGHLMLIHRMFEVYELNEIPFRHPNRLGYTPVQLARRRRFGAIEYLLSVKEQEATERGMLREPEPRGLWNALVDTLGWIVCG